MGVLACDRNGCEGIMCDRLSHLHGYICDKCFDELVATNPNDIGKFMLSKQEPPHTSEDPFNKFDREFSISLPGGR